MATRQQLDLFSLSSIASYSNSYPVAKSDPAWDNPYSLPRIRKSRSGRAAVFSQGWLTTKTIVLSDGIHRTYYVYRWREGKKVRSRNLTKALWEKVQSMIDGGVCNASICLYLGIRH